MTIQEGPDQYNEKGVKLRWPIEEGLTAGTTRQTGSKHLKPTRKSFIPDRKRVGL